MEKTELFENVYEMIKSAALNGAKVAMGKEHFAALGIKVSLTYHKVSEESKGKTSGKVLPMFFFSGKGFSHTAFINLNDNNLRPFGRTAAEVLNSPEELDGIFEKADFTATFRKEEAEERAARSEGAKLGRSFVADGIRCDITLAKRLC